MWERNHGKSQASPILPKIIPNAIKLAASLHLKQPAEMNACPSLDLRLTAHAPVPYSGSQRANSFEDRTWSQLPTLRTRGYRLFAACTGRPKPGDTFSWSVSPTLTADHAIAGSKPTTLLAPARCGSIAQGSGPAQVTNSLTQYPVDKCQEVDGHSHLIRSVLVEDRV